MTSGLKAVQLSISYAGLTQQNIYDLNIVRCGTLYEISFSTDFMYYECFVESGADVVGFSCQPLSEEQMLQTENESCAG